MIIDFIIFLLVLFAIYGIAGLALNLTLGWGGLINLGFMGFLSIGAYTSAILTTEYHLPVFVGIIAGMILAALISGFVGILIRTIRGDALAIILLGFNFTVYAIGLNWNSVTRGALGIPGIPRPEFFYDDRRFLFLVTILLLLTTLFLYRLTHSSFGRVLGAIRDEELHARVLGKRMFRVKMIVHIVSGALAGLAGALLAHFIRFIDPASFFIHQLVFVLSMIFVGGLASVPGTIIGAFILTLLPEMIRVFVNLPSDILGAIRGIIFSLLLLLVVMFRPKGILGTVELPSAYADRE
ncbi:MAG: branched-chain amino acid ABC transporter permease [Candidatus Uhrbacteria bacterium]|nr:branched-chain amino acid ABC transporter permease [Candidatus Uhrbacteria bacterium]